MRQHAAPVGHWPTQWWTRLDDGRVRCDVCPRACALHEGQHGLCFVRARHGDAIVSTTYGRSSGFCVDPIEKKPLHHFLPGSPVLSFGTAGCNLACRYCQNWDISKSRETDVLADAATPQQIARAGVDAGCASVAFTYNDPVVFVEYAADAADACHEVGLRTVAVSAGYVQPGARQQLFSRIDAANIDLKAFDDDFYHRVCGGHLAPVLDTLEWLAARGVWLEITTLVVPGLNDADAELRAMSRWIIDHLGPQVPLHFSAFHPDFRMLDVPPTPPQTLARARQLAMDEGLRYVYTGNVHDRDGGTTLCPNCHTAVVVRDWYRIERYDLTDDGRCVQCDSAVDGVFAGPVGEWGRRRHPLHLVGTPATTAGGPP
ncbi:MAG TPA: AmmeMemoRadiSam system radical SAM enzyme [Ilumatobacteraceae bacterium]|nr:AmmeMemoRadiSam system radical SAM enzyme [Ilumatobacteraceae bacterium]